MLDSGGANLGSVQAALARLDIQAPVSSDWATIRAATHLLLPGVGAAGAAMSRLRENGLDRLIPRLGQPLLGICIGMQLLFERSQEGDTECLGLLPGVVRRLPAAAGIRVPHMGWNRLAVRTTDALVDGLDGEWVYFVHSFAAPAGRDDLAIATHGGDFPAVVRRGTVMGVQFHPERSSLAGQRLLRNFLEL
jgi:glutamine amidotransferase